MRSANLSGADLSGANLRSANLSGANLSDADMSGADLRSANLRSADMRSANLSGADMSGADMRSTNLSDADLSGANLRSARTDKRYIVISCIGSRKDSTIFCFDDDELWCGCFKGSLAEFEQVVNKTHANNPQYLKEYMGAIQYIRSLPSGQKEDESE